MSIVGSNTGNNGTLGPNGAYVTFFGPFVAPASGTIGDVTLLLENSGGNNPTDWTFGVYSDSAGSPGTLLRSTVGGSISEVTSGGVEHTQNLSSSLTITSGTSYWFGAATPNIAYRYLLTAQSGFSAYYQAITYSSGSMPAVSSPTLFDNASKGHVYSTITGGGTSAVVTEQNLPANHLGNITVHVVGTGTSFTSSTTWTPSGVSGWTVASKTQVDGTHYTVVLTPPTAATPPAGATGTLTLTEGVTGTVTATTTVGTPSFTRSPTSGATGTTPTLTLTGTNTLWAGEVAAGLFTVSGGTGASLATPTVTTDAAATDVLTVGSAAGTLTITDTSTGATVTFAASAASVTLTSPVAHQLFQREGVGAGQGKGDLVITGTYVGTPAAIEASWSGGAYQTVVSSPSGGTFSTKLPRQSAGNGTLTVRFTDDTSVSASVANVKVGDLYVVAGQSNAAGRGTNNQSYTGTSGWASKYYSAWAALADPAGTDGSAAGSVWPLVANSVVGTGQVPVAFVNVAVGGTPITDWLPGAGAGYYATLLAKVAASGNGVCRAVLWWQGETDALASMSQATYYGHLLTLSAAIRDDLGCKLVPCKLQNSSGITDADEARINAAVAQAWQQDAGTEAGPDLTDLASDDSYHLQTDAHLLTAAGRWFTAIQTLYYAAAGTGVSGARIFGGF